MTDLGAFTAAVRQFSAERDWEQFQDPRSLVLALTGEVGEVAELVQWLPEGAQHEALADPARRSRFGDELADVLIYLVRLADVAGVDLGAAAEAKLARNRKRFPVGGPHDVRGRAPVKE
ncbi:MAG: nucleotide pyrophosphohydrolase [Cellulomonadaceae bacterium]